MNEQEHLYSCLVRHVAGLPPHQIPQWLNEFERKRGMKEGSSELRTDVREVYLRRNNDKNL